MKNLKLLIMILLLPVIVGLGTSSTQKYCIGSVYSLDDKEDIVDIKIGRRNKEVVVYKKPKQNISSIDELTKYEFSLNMIQEIKSLKTTTQIKNSYGENEEFVNVEITSKKNQKIVNGLIPKKDTITAKSKETGWNVSYSLDKINKLTITRCYTKDNENEESED